MTFAKEEFPCLCFGLQSNVLFEIKTLKKIKIKNPKPLKHILKCLVPHPKRDKFPKPDHIYIVSALRLISAKEKCHIKVQGSKMKP